MFSSDHWFLCNICDLQVTTADKGKQQVKMWGITTQKYSVKSQERYNWGLVKQHFLMREVVEQQDLCIIMWRGVYSQHGTMNQHKNFPFYNRDIHCKQCQRWSLHPDSHSSDAGWSPRWGLLSNDVFVTDRLSFFLWSCSCGSKTWYLWANRD